MTTFHPTGDALWERMERAAQNVRDRLERAATALEQAGVPYAVSGGNAVQAWVSQIDEAAVRNTRDVDILLRRIDFNEARTALEQAGFVYRHATGIEMFLDGPNPKARDAVHIVCAAEKVQDDYVLPSPDVTDSEQVEQFRILSLERLVRMKLTSYHDKDRVHVRDMRDVGLIDETWCDRLPGELVRSAATTPRRSARLM